MIRGHARRRTRKGSALVELALCLPLLTLLVLGSIELRNFIFLKQSMTAAAYEASREAVRPTATDATAQAVADAIFTGRELTGATLSISPTAMGTERGTLITVTASAPSDANRIVMPKFIEGLAATGVCIMAKE